MAAVPAIARLAQTIARLCAKTMCVAGFPTCVQSGVQGDHRSAKLKQQAIVDIDPETPIARLTRRVRHPTKTGSNERRPTVCTSYPTLIVHTQKDQDPGGAGLTFILQRITMRMVSDSGLRVVAIIAEQ